MSIAARLGIQHLFSDLSLKWKIISVIIPLIIAILLLGYALIRDKGRAIEFTRKETYGVEYNHALRDLMQTLMEHRGLASLTLNGDIQSKAQLQQKQTQISARLKAVQEAEARYGAALETAKEWRNLQAHWRQLQQQLMNLSPEESITRHNALVRLVIDLMAHVGHSSNLTLDSHTDSYYLIDTLQNQLPNLIETIGRMRATAIKAAEHPQADGKDKVTLIGLQSIADFYKKQVERNVRIIIESTPTLKASRFGQSAAVFSEASNRFFNLINKSLRPETNAPHPLQEEAPEASATDIYHTATEAVNAGFQLFDIAFASLSELLTDRIAKLKKEQYLAFGGMGLFILFARGIGFIVISAIVRPIQKAEAASNAIAEGRLDNIIENSSQDEAGRMLASLGEMQKKLRQQIEKERLHFQEQALLLKELEEKNAELERFIYTVSHDLRSPLITIQGFSGMLKHSIAQGNIERLQGDIQRIHTAADRMHALLDDLLELSRIGRLVHIPEQFSLQEFAEEAIKLVQGSLEKHEVQVTIIPPLPTLFGDRKRFLEVMQNLIENAAKFMGNQAAPQIKIGGREEAGEVLCYVQDNGIGIHPRYHEKIFGLFERLDQHKEGTGIGLAIVKRIIEIHRGRIWVESEGQPGHGSTFYFSIPRDNAQNER